MKQIAMMSEEVAGEFVSHVAAKPANCASSSSKEAEKIAIEKVTSGHTIDLPSYPEEHDELEDLGSTDRTSEVKGEGDVSAAEASMGLSVESNVGVFVGCLPAGSLEELEPAELPGPYLKSKTPPKKPLIR